MSTERAVAGYVPLRLQDGDPIGVFQPIGEGGQNSGLLADASAPPPWHGRTLRVALAMKGGLSLAVWIGGAIAELDVLRRIRIYRSGKRARALLYHVESEREKDSGPWEQLVPRAEEYARLLSSHGYDRVEFDVLAGASAGGLNGVLYGVAQRAGVGFGSILDTWISAGAAWGLLQTGSPAQFDAIGRGDGYFWPEVANAISTMIETRPETSPLRAENLVVDLSATLIDAVDSSDRTAVEGRAQFRFVGDDADAIRDRAIPPARKHDVPEDGADIARIAYAARSTSSFPFVFEPALIYSGSTSLAKAPGWEQRRDRTSGIDAPDMRMVFNAHRPDASTEPFRVVDGGLLDNIPIDRALNAVRNMPAMEHTNRAIVYLDPSPKEAAGLFRRPTAYDGARPTLQRHGRRFTADTSIARDDVGSRLLGTLNAAMRKRGVRESRDDEIEDVDLVRATVSVAKARNELLAVRLAGSALNAKEERIAGEAYALYRATSDLELLTPPLLHPGEWLLGTDLRERPALIALDRLGIVYVEAAFRALADRLQERSDGQARSTATGRQALVDASMASLSWIRSIEQTAFQEGRLDVLDDRLATVSTTHPGLRSRRDLRAALNRVMAPARTMRDDAILDTLVRIQRRTDGGSLNPTLADELVAIWRSEDTAEDHTRTRAWTELDCVVARQFEVSTLVDELASRRWQRTPWSRLSAPSSGMPASQLPLLFGGSGIPQPISSVRFHRIGSDIQPAAAPGYRKLMEDQLLRGYRAALARPVDELDSVTVSNLLDESTLRSTAKLAGLRAANIAGFLSRDWRRNDWWWGRLDAAAGIVELMQSFPPAPQKRPAPEAGEVTSSAAHEDVALGTSYIDHREPDETTARQAEILATVHDSLLRQLAVAPQAPFTHDDETTDDITPSAVRERFVRGSQGLDALSDGYRVAIAARTVRAISIALARGQRIWSPRRFAHWLIRPLLALAPVAISAPRAILLFSLFVCGAFTIWPDIEPPPVMGDKMHIVAISVTALVVALVFGRVVAAMNSRRQHERRVLRHTGTKSWVRRVRATARRNARTGQVVFLAATLLGGTALISIAVMWDVDNVPYWAALIVLLALGEAAAHAVQTVPASLARPTAKRIVPVITALIVGALAICGSFAATVIEVVPWLTSIPPLLWLTPQWAPVGLHAAGAALIAGAVAIVMLAGCFKRRRRIVAPVVWVIVAAAAASVVVEFTVRPLSTFAWQLADVLVIAWAAGTALWWAPWYRGRATLAEEAPSDAARDLDWADTRVPARAARRQRASTRQGELQPTPAAVPA
ncbi:DUF3376 domain-containing protein [Agromyces neolithicus]|uniref:PNPLA domain-containing protein n=1 Tax=Agromyces neolithicus TaxID=269420 RepID=A0ABN2LXX6_9MICO